MIQKYYCPKCKKFELKLKTEPNNTFDTNLNIYICSNCGYTQTEIPIINEGNINVFPNPNNDLQYDPPISKKVNKMRRPD